MADDHGVSAQALPDRHDVEFPLGGVRRAQRIAEFLEENDGPVRGRVTGR